MKLFADEHIARTIMAALRSDGHDVVAIADVAAGSSDTANLELAIREGRGILTFDSDYGDLVFQAGLQAPDTIIYIRMDPRDLDAISSRLIPVLRMFPAAGRMVVIEKERVRTRAFPPVKRT